METKRIIIAEDSEILRKAYVTLVKDLFKDTIIDETDDGDQLIERVKSNKYNLILTDNDMVPGSSTGLDAIREIRKFDKETPIYLVSGKIGIENDALKTGATGVIEKGTRNNVEAFEEVIIKYLS